MSSNISCNGDIVSKPYTYREATSVVVCKNSCESAIN